jgi:pyruvate dehydrogenase E1 component
MARGFVVGATAGRTTLNGEGLQHEDGHSPLLATTNPACVAYDPAFTFEVGHIVQDALRRMYGGPADLKDGEDQNVFYYLTVYNEPYRQPPEPEGLDVAGLLQGMYLYAPAVGGPVDGEGARHRAQILASGVAVTWALRAQQLLRDEWAVDADVWSATSWSELRREAMACDEHNLMHPGEEERVPFVTRRLRDTDGPVVAVSDYMRAVPDQIATYVGKPWLSLGTDGFGMSDTRGALRRHFMVDAESVAIGALTLLARGGEIGWDVVQAAHAKYRLDDVTAVTVEEAGGET